MDRAQLLAHALEQSQESGRHGDAAQAVFHAMAAAELAQALSELEPLAQAQSLLVLHLFALGRFPAALRHGQSALRSWQSLGQPERICETQQRLALVMSELGIHIPALQMARAAMALAREHHLAAGLHRALALCGALQGRVGHAEEAEQLLLQAFSRAREAGDQEACTKVLNALLTLLATQVEEAAALGDAKRSAQLKLRLRPRIGPSLAHCAQEPQLLARVTLRGNVAAALAACGEVADALAMQRACAEQAAGHGFRVVEMRSRSRLAGLLLDSGQADAAALELQCLQSLLSTEAHEGAELALRRLQARLAQHQGDQVAAATWQQQADALAKAQADRLAELHERAQAEVDAVMALLEPPMH